MCVVYQIKKKKVRSMLANEAVHKLKTDKGGKKKKK